MIVAALALTAAQIDAVATRAGLAGEVLVAKGDAVLIDKGYGTIAPGGPARHRAGARWRLASITKQITAAMLIRKARAGGIALDAPLGPVLHQDALGALTARQLLQHHSGLANPDETRAGADGVPAFYKAATPNYPYCFSKPAAPGSPFSYNNCDYLIASKLLGGSKDQGRRWPAGMAMAKSGEMGVPGYVGGKPEPHYELASFGAAGGLMGTAKAVFAFDRGLMTHRTIDAAGLAELWKSEGGRSYQAVGQWVFPGQLKGCAAPKRIVQRDGEIGGVQTRNYILPDDDLVVVVFTNRSSDDFPIGEIWQGKGFAYDLLSAVACG
ncbi:CubicO group peptidase (beta-lactamase class C family) [Sphingomonas vulcanisoli]|uniref:CubicO group peptidase (Beta-lactamase class C family) n=1 Tax=Sphingomonas vulcanisoli TaxID=1658060 RepID=A0ABX0TSZ8_9SPHN|nr:serine hydrolase domain-containing protein [Sphingomonas vulcanisoli]NIJ08647.1 CubicO group peptidase (beta-lactamase class C family) [Sphingomonas vulcanisoli]